MKRTNKHSKKASKSSKTHRETADDDSGEMCTGYATVEDEYGNPVDVPLFVIYMWSARAHERLPDQTEILHINGDLDDVRSENLRWATMEEMRVR